MAAFRDLFCRAEGFAHVSRYVTGLSLSPNKTLQGIYELHPREAERLPPENMVSAYKAQGVSVEREFRLLKAPLFFADSLFVKRPKRPMAWRHTRCGPNWGAGGRACPISCDNRRSSPRCGGSCSFLRASTCCGCRSQPQHVDAQR